MSKERHDERDVLHTVGLVDDAAVHLDVGCSIWIDLDYKQYEDRATCDIKFVAGDIFHDDLLQTLQRLAQRCSNVPAERTPPDPPRSNIRCISAFSFFHLFDEAGQKDLAIKLGVAFNRGYREAPFTGHIEDDARQDE
ncbi:hypothetical protein QFC21_006785 [Naganishia friedmannii]|uniref:Uncharacterized protein n=1 Tax=Naganishia friedmannii TaxID=89922 RepID=A0ACC2V045_9TREE|nr:hypothetical protein QFC21_006785 [Naganishia friedmannii]